MNHILKQKKATKLGIFSWCLFDWANSAFPTVMTTFIFATYFTSSVAVDKLQGTRQWADATALAGLLIALLSPVSGAIADLTGQRKRWLALFVLLVALPCLAMWWVKPEHSDVYLALGLMVIATVAFEMGSVFYNALLPQVAPASHLGRISGWGWALGYLGGLACLLLLLVGFVQNPVPWLGLTKNELQQIRISGPVVAIWFVVFALPLFLFVNDKTTNNKLKLLQAAQQGLKKLVNTLKTLPQQKALLRFLIARMLYIDGVNTLFAFGGIYAAGTMGFTMTQIILFGILMNVAAALGAFVLAWCDDWLGSKLTIVVALLAILALGIGIILSHSVILFWVLTLSLGLFLGPAQAASRTLMARLTPVDKRNAYFGLYALSGKATMFISPWLFGVMTVGFGSQRAGIASILVFISLGLLILLGVQSKTA